jgi:hypothetical protein
LTSGWYIQGTTIQVQNITNYVNNEERQVITSITPSSFSVNSPTIITISTVTQYYLTLKSTIPVYALINGTNTTLTSGWYNAGSRIQVENLTYYPTPYERQVIISISPLLLTLTEPITIRVGTITQYYVTLEAQIPVYALINGTNTTLTSGWYNAGSRIQVENITQYPIKGEREVIVNMSPSSLTVNTPQKIKVDDIIQYYVTVSSPIPVKAVINGTIEYLNNSWINANTKIKVLNYTYYINNEERCVMTRISLQNITLNNPEKITVSTVKQYLVTIKGVSSWYNKGSYVTLSASVPFYEVGKFVGTYNVSPGSVIEVNGPINETLVESPNIPIIGLMSAVVVLIIVLVIVLLKMKKSKK